MSAFDSQEYMSRFGAALQGTQGGMQPSQVGGYGGYEGNSSPLGGAQDPGAIGSQTTAANDTAPSLVNSNMQARMLYRSQQRPQTPRPPPLGHEQAGRPAQDPGVAPIVPANAGVSNLPPQAPNQPQGALPQGQPPQQQQQDQQPPIGPGSGPQGGALAPQSPNDVNHPEFNDRAGLMQNANFYNLAKDEQNQIAQNLNKAIEKQTNGSEDIHSVYSSLYQKALQDHTALNNTIEAAATDAMDKPTLRDKASMVMDALSRAAVASGQGMPAAAAIAFGARGALEAHQAYLKGEHDAVIQKSAELQAAAQKDAKEGTDQYESQQNIIRQLYLAQPKMAEEQANATKATAETPTPAMNQAKLKLTQNQAAEAAAKAQEALANKDKSKIDAKGDMAMTLDDGTTGTYNLQSKVFTQGTTSDGKPLTGAKKTGTQGTATDDKAQANARLTFESLQKAATARNSKSMDPRDASKDTTQEVLASMRVNFPDQYDALVGNPAGTTKKAPPKATPKSAASAAQGATAAQQAAVDAQVNQDTKAQPKKPAWAPD